MRTQELPELREPSEEETFLTVATGKGSKLPFTVEEVRGRDREDESPTDPSHCYSVSPSSSRSTNGSGRDSPCSRTSWVRSSTGSRTCDTGCCPGTHSEWGGDGLGGPGRDGYTIREGRTTPVCLINLLADTPRSAREVASVWVRRGPGRMGDPPRGERQRRGPRRTATNPRFF